MQSQDTSGFDSSDNSGTATKEVPKVKSRKKEQGPLIASLLCFPALLVSVATIFMSVLGFLSLSGDTGWFCEICASLRAQYILLLLICMLPALFSPPWRIPLVSACSLFLLINLAFLAPSLLPAGAPQDANLKYLKFKVMEISVNNSAADLKPIVDEVNREKSELVCFTGLTTPQLVNLNNQFNYYLNRTAFMPDEGQGIAIYSSKPLQGTRFRRIGPDKLPVLLTTLHFDYGWFRIIAIELPAPKDGASLTKRNAQAEAVAKLCSELNGRKIVLGTFNMTPYSMAFGNLLKVGALQDSRMRFGVQPNWHFPENFDLFLLRFPIDHILVNSDVAVMSRHVGDPFSLTHRPVVAELYPANSNQAKYDPAKETAPDDIPASQALTPGSGVKPAGAAPARAKPATQPASTSSRPSQKPGKRRKRR